MRASLTTHAPPPPSRTVPSRVASIQPFPHFRPIGAVPARGRPLAPIGSQPLAPIGAPISVPNGVPTDVKPTHVSPIEHEAKHNSTVPEDTKVGVLRKGIHAEDPDATLLPPGDADGA